MNKYSFLLILGFLLFLMKSSNAQEPKTNQFQMVNVPREVTKKLESVYINELGQLEGGIYVWNLQNRKDFVFKNGIYSYQLIGPHFPRRIFIQYNSKTFVFKSAGAFNNVGVLKEYIECIKILKISDKDVAIYLNIISNYLKGELGLTYGSEIVKK